MSSRPFAALTACVAIPLALAAAALAAPVAGDGPRRSADQELARMGREIPGFGGLFYDEQGRPNVYLLAPRGAGAATLKSLGRDVIVRQGEYEFARLLAWRYELRPLLALPGLVYLDVDEARNRVVLGLDATSRGKSLDRDRLERELLFTRVPRQAILLEEAAPVVPLVSLRSKFRPAAGGVQILFPIAPPTYGVCTLGFNAFRGSVFGFVINSHCTGVRGEVDGISYSQSLPSDGTIGTEIADPGAFTDPPCPPGKKCRVSDSAFVKYANPRLGILGRIARPATNDAEEGTLNLNPAAARFTVVGRVGSPFIGDSVHKVGRTTGWTFGTVVATCADINVSGSTDTQLCQTRVRGGAGPGDSGSPVFYRVGFGAKVKLAGILWGGGSDPINGATYIFSPLDNIEEDLGPLKVN